MSGMKTIYHWSAVITCELNQVELLLGKYKILFIRFQETCTVIVLLFNLITRCNSSSIYLLFYRKQASSLGPVCQHLSSVVGHVWNKTIYHWSVVIICEQNWYCQVDILLWQITRNLYCNNTIVQSVRRCNNSSTILLFYRKPWFLNILLQWLVMSGTKTIYH